MRNKKVNLSPPPTSLDPGLPYQWITWIESLYQRVGSGPFAIQGYLKSGLPDASKWFGSAQDNSFTGVIFVVDDSGGPTLAFSNGSNWLRIRDNSIIS